MLTFPHMGNTYISIKALLDELRVDYIMPPFNNKKTLELGTAAVPEGACLPLKITVGALIAACETGADTIVMASALGPCRFGYYCPMQKELLADAGYATSTIHFAPPRGDYIGLYRLIRRISGKSSLLRFFVSLFGAAKIAHRVDALERRYFYTQPRELKKGRADAVYKAFQKDVLQAHGQRAINALLQKAQQEMEAIPKDESAQPLRLGIVGEIFDNIDPFSSLYLQEKLGRMGVEIFRPITISHWLDFVWSRFIKVRKKTESFENAARPYLKTAIGGHAQETIGHAVLFGKHKFDGIIQIYPLGCMPEIVAQSILPTVSAQENIPILTVVLDELTGEAGLMTRVEAFLDLLNRRREDRERVQLRMVNERKNA